MSLEVTGKLIAKLGQQTGQGKNGTWVRQDFIIETQEQYPKKICLSAWGDKVRDFDSFAMGELIKASINIESREYNGRWYTDIRPWRVERMAQNDNAGASSVYVPPITLDSIPPAAPIEAPADASDILPF